MLRAIIAALAFTSLSPLPTFAKEITIQPGETLSGIAEKYKVSVTTLKSLNGIHNPKELKAGAQLKLPDSAYLKSNNEPKMHKVGEGETLAKIASKYNLTQQEIININNIQDTNYLHIGQSLKLPYIQKSNAAKNTLLHRVA